MAVIAIEDVVHHWDAEAKKKLESMAALRPAIAAFHRAYSDRELRNQQLSSYIRLGPRQIPEIYRLLPPICEAYGIDEPELFLAPGDVNAATMGITRPSITINAGLLTELELDEVEVILAHECGHILGRHLEYRSMASVLEAAISLGGDVGIPFASVFLKLAAGPLTLALEAWSRASELTADRAATAYVGNSEVVKRALMRMAGLPAGSGFTINVDDFARQALEFDALAESKWDKFLQWKLSTGSTHPLLAVRVRDAHIWAASPAFAPLAARAEAVRNTTRCRWCGRTVIAGWQTCYVCGASIAVPQPRTEPALGQPGVG